MFSLFSWRSTPILSLPPPHPELPKMEVLSTPSAQTTSPDLIQRLTRIEAKIDLIVTKLEFLEQRHHGFRTITTDPSPRQILTLPGGNKGPEEPVNSVHLDFQEELTRRIEELKILKHMGESHGFGSAIDLGATPDVIKP